MTDDAHLDTDLREALQRLWRDEKPSLSTGGSAAVEDLQSRYGLILPEAFAAYLRSASPDRDWMHGGGIIWWPPERIKSLRDECGSETPNEQLNAEIEVEADTYLIFADYLDWCYAYAICCSVGPNRGKIALIAVRPDRFVASSFVTFVDLVAADSDRLHSPVGDHFTDVA